MITRKVRLSWRRERVCARNKAFPREKFVYGSCVRACARDSYRVFATGDPRRRQTQWLTKRLTCKVASGESPRDRASRNASSRTLTDHTTITVAVVQTDTHRHSPTLRSQQNSLGFTIRRAVVRSLFAVLRQFTL